MEFPCTGCGICCTKVGKLVDAVNFGILEEEDFPYDHKDGRCEMLGEDNKCTIYDTRPTICSVEGMFETDIYDELLKINKTTKKQYYIDDAIKCNQWMTEEGYKGDLIDISKIK